MFLQTGVVLFTGGVTLAAVEQALADLGPGRRVDADADTNPWFAGTEGSLVLPCESGSNGALAITPFAEVWPDSMGDTEENFDLFGAWSLHFFGWAAFPLGLARSAARDGAPRGQHAAFVRINLSYIFGEDEDLPLEPADRDIAAELAAMAVVAERLCQMPGAWAWYTPNGEVLLPVEAALPLLRRQAAGEAVWELWIGIRAIPAKQHMLLETVGMTTLGPLYSYDHQLLLPDLGLTPDVMTKFVAELSGATQLRGAASLPAEPVLGPAGRWRPVLSKSANPPPRELVRWVHESSAEVTEDVVELEQAEAERWGEHLKSLLGGDCTVFHELLSDTIHLDVLAFAPTPQRPNPVLVTQGMSALPMRTPEGAEDMRFAELMFVLPPHWVLLGDEAREERWYWPMRALKVVARLPHQRDTWIAPGHTIPTGDPAVPYADDTKLCCVMVGAPLLGGASIPDCELSAGKSVRLYPLIPIYEDEMSYKLEHGAEALFEKLDARSVSEVLDPKRRSVLAKRFWIV